MGLAFGTIQMVLYAVYRNHKHPQDPKLSGTESKLDVENVVVSSVTTTQLDQDPKPQVNADVAPASTVEVVVLDKNQPQTDNKFVVTSVSTN